MFCARASACYGIRTNWQYLFECYVCTRMPNKQTHTHTHIHTQKNNHKLSEQTFHQISICVCAREHSKWKQFTCFRQNVTQIIINTSEMVRVCACCTKTRLCRLVYAHKNAEYMFCARNVLWPAKTFLSLSQSSFFSAASAVKYSSFMYLQ